MEICFTPCLAVKLQGRGINAFFDLMKSITYKKNITFQKKDLSERKNGV